MLYYLCVKYITYHEDDFDNDDKKHDIANDKTWLAAPISSGTGCVICSSITSHFMIIFTNFLRNFDQIEQVKIWFQNRRMKWRNSKERELLAQVS